MLSRPLCFIDFSMRNFALWPDRGSRFSLHDFRLQQVNSALDLRDLAALLNFIQDSFDSNRSHFFHRLAYRRQAWVEKRRIGDIVKAQNGTIFWNAPAKIAQGSHRAEGGEVVKSHQRSKTWILLQHSAGQ